MKASARAVLPRHAATMSDLEFSVCGVDVSRICEVPFSHCVVDESGTTRQSMTPAAEVFVVFCMIGLLSSCSILTMGSEVPLYTSLGSWVHSAMPSQLMFWWCRVACGWAGWPHEAFVVCDFRARSPCAPATPKLGTKFVPQSRRKTVSTNSWWTRFCA